MARALDNGNVVCEQCENEYKQIGQHWSMSTNCYYTEISDYKKEILIGLLMGDGCLKGRNEDKNSSIITHMISPNYLEYIDNKLGWLSTGVRFFRSAEKSAKLKENDEIFTSNPNNYSDIYRLLTRSHPFITSLNKWYSSGSKVWPDNIELTPTVLKHWYCGDGSYDVSSNGTNSNWKNSSIRITVCNEQENIDKLSNYFTSQGLPSPNFHRSESNLVEGGHCNISWGKEDSQELFEYMGEPLPDFYYKWPTEYR